MQVKLFSGKDYEVEKMINNFLLQIPSNQILDIKICKAEYGVTILIMYK